MILLPVVAALLVVFPMDSFVDVDRRRILKGKIEYLRARIDDLNTIEQASFPALTQNSRDGDIDFCTWVVEGLELLKVSDELLTLVNDSRSFPISAMNRKVFDEMVDFLTVHEKKGDMLYAHALSDELGLHRGNPIPVKEIIGQVGLNTLDELKHLLQDSKVTRIAIIGREGIGKTFLMKHLHNSALKCVENFDYVIWATSPNEFSIKQLQDAIAAAVNCDFSTDDDENIRARKLSKSLRDLGKFVLFLDGVPKSNISLDEIGIPVPAEGSECKVVLTTSSDSRCRIFEGFRTVEVDCLSDKEAFELFMQETGMEMKVVALLNDIPVLVAKKCGGVPRMILSSASRMCGIDDLHEWKNALFELRKLEKRTKLLT